MRPSIVNMKTGGRSSLGATAALMGAAMSLAASQVSAATLKTLHAFEFCNSGTCADGSSPYGNLVRDSQGNFYGTTAEGGEHAQGTIFELSPDGKGGWNYKTIYSFCAEDGCEDGANPQATLIIDINGTLYGTTQGPEAGKAFRLTPANGGWELVPIHEFCGEEEGEDCIGGSNPSGGLTYRGAETGAPYDGVSALYGATLEGGEGEAGVIYQLKPPHRDVEDWRVKELYVFCPDGGEARRAPGHAGKGRPIGANCEDGKMPSGGLTIDSAGNLYGTTYYGGEDANLEGGAGVVFKLSRGAGQTWTQSVLHRFCEKPACSDGQNPYDGLLMDSAGSLFGATLRGGSKCGRRDPCGVAFEIRDRGDNQRFRILHAFCRAPRCADGQGPEGEFAMDAQGDIFGATLLGGSHRGGSVFRLNGKTLETLYSFCSLAGCADGRYPAGVVTDESGNLFGVTTVGGEGGGGTIFELTP
ncbi:MAG TPA: choice-of-anchor tandem repeat GloVer-containing protein [Rhizomicrobium sp.]|nr:choice-of-anchor tandem repeat GloVer-containing protein [Rhizomicrobium sp.]